MHIFNVFIYLLLANLLLFVFVETRTIHDDDAANEENMHEYSTRHLHQSASIHEQLLSLLANEQNNNLFQMEQDRLSGVGRRAKAIIKGDPREFMG